MSLAAILSRPLRRTDWLLAILVGALLAGGLITLYSASLGANYFDRQIQYIGVGVILMLGCASIPWTFWKWIALPAYLGVLLLLIAVALFGLEVNNSKRWLDLGMLTLQPSELAKVAVPLTVAVFYGLFEHRRWWHHTVAVILILIPVLLVFRQPDLGTSVMMMAAGVFVIFFAGLSWLLITAGLGLAIAFAPHVWHVLLKDYQRERILTLFDPYQDPMGAGYHTIQANIAVGSGGLWGKGWGLGSQSQLGFLPERHTDFIFAVLAEEFGLAGSLALLTMITLVFLRMFAIALRTDDDAGSLAACGLAFAFLTHCLVNLGMVSGVLPVVGLPLPLVSYGGTALITLFAGFGIIMAIAKHARPRQLFL